jgi:hypothetical protein
MLCNAPLLSSFLYLIQYILLIFFPLPVVFIGNYEKKSLKKLFEKLNSKYSKFTISTLQIGKSLCLAKKPISIEALKNIPPLSEKNYQNILWTLFFVSEVDYQSKKKLTSTLGTSIKNILGK